MGQDNETWDKGNIWSESHEYFSFSALGYPTVVAHGGGAEVKHGGLTVLKRLRLEFKAAETCGIYGEGSWKRNLSRGLGIGWRAEFGVGILT